MGKGCCHGRQLLRNLGSAYHLLIFKRSESYSMGYLHSVFGMRHRRIMELGYAEAGKWALDYLFKPKLDASS